MPCKVKVALIFVLLACSFATKFGSGAYHAPGPVLQSPDVRHRDVRRLRCQGLLMLRWLGGSPDSWITHQLRALHHFFEFDILSPISFLQSCSQSFLGSERAPTSSDLEGESSTHCFWNCDFDTTAVAHFCINSTATSAANFLQSESPLQQGLLQGTGTTVDSLSNSFTTVFSCTASCDVCSDPGTVQQAVFNQQSCSGRSQCSNESHSNSFFRWTLQ